VITLLLTPSPPTFVTEPVFLSSLLFSRFFFCPAHFSPPPSRSSLFPTDLHVAKSGKKKTKGGAKTKTGYQIFCAATRAGVAEGEKLSPKEVNVMWADLSDEKKADWKN
jgi:hypothetical protein